MHLLASWIVRRPFTYPIEIGSPSLFSNTLSPSLRCCDQSIEMHTTSTTNGEPVVASTPEKPVTGEAGKENIKEEPQSSKKTPTRILRYAEVQVHTIYCFN